MDEFQGIPVSAVGFYARLSGNNTREWWSTHKTDYDTLVRAPMVALAAGLEAEFGQARVYRPNRDLRFTLDKSPYKNHQGIVVSTSSGMGWYAQVSAAGFMTAGGWYEGAPDQLARYRLAVDDDVSGPELQVIVDNLRLNGFTVEGQLLKTRPRGVSMDHPRLELLRYRSLVASAAYGIPDWLESAEVLDHVREDWRTFKPLLDWLTEHVDDDEEKVQRSGRPAGRNRS